MLISSPPVLNNLEGNIEETALIISAVKLVVAELARRSWPAGGSVLGGVRSRTNCSLRRLKRTSGELSPRSSFRACNMFWMGPRNCRGMAWYVNFNHYINSTLKKDQQ